MLFHATLRHISSLPPLHSYHYDAYHCRRCHTDYDNIFDTRCRASLRVRAVDAICRALMPLHYILSCHYDMLFSSLITLLPALRCRATALFEFSFCHAAFHYFCCWRIAAIYVIDDIAIISLTPLIIISLLMFSPRHYCRCHADCRFRLRRVSPLRFSLAYAFFSLLLLIFHAFVFHCHFR